MTARCLTHVWLAAFGVFVAALNLAGPHDPTLYLLAGGAAGPAVGRFLTDRRKLAPGYYGPPTAAARSTDWKFGRDRTFAAPDPETIPESPRVAKLRRLAEDPRTPPGERDAALAALRRLGWGVAA